MPHLAFADTSPRPCVVDIIVEDVMVLDSALTASLQPGLRYITLELCQASPPEVLSHPTPPLLLASFSPLHFSSSLSSTSSSPTLPIFSSPSPPPPPYSPSPPSPLPALKIDRKMVP